MSVAETAARMADLRAASMAALMAELRAAERVVSRAKKSAARKEALRAQWMDGWWVARRVSMKAVLRAEM